MNFKEMHELSKLAFPETTKRVRGGILFGYSYDNGYGASVICTPGSYGSASGLLELGVLHEGHLCYSTPITDDVLGYPTAYEVCKILVRIEKL